MYVAKNIEEFLKVVESQKITLAGSNYCPHGDKVTRILAQTRTMLGFLIRNPEYEDAIDLYALSGNQSFADRDYIRVGVLGTNYAYESTLNGKIIAARMKVGEAYPIIFEIKQSEKVEKGSRSIFQILRTDTTTYQYRLAEGIEDFINISNTIFKSHYRLTDTTNPKPSTGSFDLKTKERRYEKDESGTWTTVNLSGINLQPYSNSSVVNANPCCEVPLTTAPLTKAPEATIGTLQYNPVGTAQLQTKTQEEKKPMKSFNTMFSKFGSDFAYSTKNFAMSMFGGLAVKTKAGNFVTFNKDTLEVVDTMDMVMDGFEDFIMIVPVQKLEDGDLFIKNGSVFAMIDADANEAFSFDESTIVTLMTVKNAFGMNLYAKVFNVMGSMGASGATSNGVFGNPLMMMMMMKDEDGGKNSNMMQMLMMSQMFSGGMKF